MHYALASELNLWALEVMSWAWLIFWWFVAAILCCAVLGVIFSGADRDK